MRSLPTHTLSRQIIDHMMVDDRIWPRYLAGSYAALFFRTCDVPVTTEIYLHMMVQP